MWWLTQPTKPKPDYDANVIELVKSRRPLPAGFEPRALRCLTCDVSLDLLGRDWAETYVWLDAHDACAVEGER